MEREAVMPDQAFLFLFLDEIPDMEPVVFFIVAPLQSVQQIIVEIARIGPFQAGIEFALCRLLVVDFT